MIALEGNGSVSNIDAAAVIESAAESILITDTDLDAPGPKVIYVNPAFERMTGWTRSEIIGKSPRVLQGPESDLRVFADMRERLLSGHVWEGLTINYRKDGSTFWMEWSIVPLRNAQGEIYQYLAVQRDVTRRKQTEIRLQEAEAAERAAEKARANLSRYFSPKLVDTLAGKDQPLGAVRRQNLAVLFADVIGFTKIAESSEPEYVIELLRDLHKWMERAIFDHDGSIEGYIGDAVLAIFGFPAVGEKDASNALACAYALLEAAKDWNRERMERGLPSISIGIGLHYGPVVLGDVGSEEYLEFTVVGDTVNVASRLQQATRKLGCDLVVGRSLVEAVEKEAIAKSESTEALLEPLQPQGALEIRGRSQAVQVSILPGSKAGVL